MNRCQSNARPTTSRLLSVEGCIASHAAAAQKVGASKQEVAEAPGGAITLNAGAAFACSARAPEAFDQFDE
ncbi:carboxymuconolactone decarboxylase family protein [Paraburkholderia denitrificans]|uniref:Carboxymuconolactone decarboxylase family protein n=1 Tax=Paraburkholderia denitrificans TaxID=694025 RepID=A0ABW0J5I0_9BURK